MASWRDTWTIPKCLDEIKYWNYQLQFIEGKKKRNQAEDMMAKAEARLEILQEEAADVKV